MELPPTDFESDFSDFAVRRTLAQKYAYLFYMQHIRHRSRLQCNAVK